MFPLDSKTVERLAEVVVDMGGPYERKGYRLAELLAAAGWADPPEYDGSPRIPWLTEQLEERRENRADVERFLCRVCDPIEYDEGAVIADEFRAIVNEKLAPEGLVVTVVSGRPVVGRLGPDGKQPTFSEPADFRRRLEKLLADPVTIDMLMGRLEETRICESGGAYTMAVIGIGSIVEGLLLQLLLERDEELREKGFPNPRDPGRRNKPDRVTLQQMIDIAHGKDWIQLDATKFVHTVRDFRNFVHPRKELAEQPRFDQDSVMLCWAPVHALLNDLEENVPTIS
ncbi:hypothetical protein QRX50_07200 [Amycolatopsis carbonis]|uniref:DUF4145 domain-containing protein n=1 Tax=Amycolatopsis carbonis TaxID=715471 RepID=A0A9Y2IIF9_9PSEU|nr:hypothetical protein [Amycolatopsis sp. 2-15]WIX80549.1 hypothetical protein QRX50_07200 [Amycolatopsis sp. 2-15]